MPDSSLSYEQLRYAQEQLAKPAPGNVPAARAAPATIPNFESMGFEQKRFAQDQLAAAARAAKQKR